MKKPNKETKFEVPFDEFLEACSPYENDIRILGVEGAAKKHLLQRLRIFDAPGITIGVAVLVCDGEQKQERMREMLNEASRGVSVRHGEGVEWYSIHLPEEVAALAVMIRKERAWETKGGHI